MRCPKVSGPSAAELSIGIGLHAEQQNNSTAQRSLSLIVNLATSDTMHASRISIHSWEGAARLDEVIQNPDVAAVESAVRRLDGDRTTEVCIEADDESCLILGGGLGRYVGFVSRGEEEMHNLITPSGSSELQVELCAGGQTGYYAERQLVDLSTALRAARTFAERGELEPSVTWELHQ